MKKTVIIKRLKLINFRNIENTTYQFDSNRVGVAGKNRIGKTNTILAIHWLLTDKMLDGSSDVMSIKPLHNTALKVEVHALFDIDGDEVSIKKTYEEEWVKARGTSELTLKGNITEYYINDVPYKVNKALDEMQRLFGLDDIRFMNNDKIDSKININAMLCNPYYLTQILTSTEEKTLRTFIVNLCGDVFDEDVFKENPMTLGCKTILDKYHGDHTNATKFLKQQISELNQQIQILENLVVELQKQKDVEPDELKLVLNKIEEINYKIYDLKNEKTVTDPRIDALKNEIQDLKDLLNLKQEKLYENANSERTKISSSLKLLEVRRKNFVAVQNRINEDKNIKQTKITSLKNDIKLIDYKLDSLNEMLLDLRRKGRAIKDSQFDLTTDKCPNCGFALNQEEIDNKRIAFEKEKEERFEEVKKEGLRTKLEIESKQKELDSLNQNLFELTQIIDNKEEQELDYQKSIEELDKQIEEEKSKLLDTMKINDTDEILEIKSQISVKNQQMEELENLASQDNSNEELLKQLTLELNRYKEIEKVHINFTCNQNLIEENKRKIKSLYNSLNNFDTQLLALDLFVKTKLQMIDNNVSNVFGDIKIKLIKENIKEGSWQQICKPCIKGKNTLFVNGSTSEKITTGLAIIECIKRVLNLSNLPIIFDEGEALDKHSIQELQTDSQIITALVNDNYDSLTIVDLNK